MAAFVAAVLTLGGRRGRRGGGVSVGALLSLSLGRWRIRGGQERIVLAPDPEVGEEPGLPRG